MTREAELLIDMWDTLHRECHKVVTEENYDVIKKAIKALEQEPILDKIRAEIEDMNAPDYGFEGFEDFYMCQSEVLQIIDRYKAESEK